MSWKPTREEAWALLCEYNESDALKNHALAVEGVMRHFAEFFEPDEVDTWGLIGLLHDLDYEKYPDQHCQMTEKILKDKNLEPTWIRAILSHGYEICTDTKPESNLEKVLFTIDELTGLVNAAALMRPSKSVLDMPLKSLKKKFKTPSFAAGVDRDIIRKGCDLLGWDLDKVMIETIEGMKKVAADIGLDGQLAK